MKILSSPIALSTLTSLAKNRFGTMVKGVVDVELCVLALDADLHADLEATLLDQGSLQKNLWGINLYPQMHTTDEFIEYDSMINLRPSQGNMSRGVNDEAIRTKIQTIVSKLITP